MSSAKKKFTFAADGGVAKMSKLNSSGRSSSPTAADVTAYPIVSSAGDFRPASTDGDALAAASYIDVINADNASDGENDNAFDGENDNAFDGGEGCFSHDEEGDTDGDGDQRRQHEEQQQQHQQDDDDEGREGEDGEEDDDAQEEAENEPEEHREQSGCAEAEGEGKEEPAKNRAETDGGDDDGTPPDLNKARPTSFNGAGAQQRRPLPLSAFVRWAGHGGWWMDVAAFASCGNANRRMPSVALGGAA
jgi:hypothetical protein